MLLVTEDVKEMNSCISTRGVNADLKNHLVENNITTKKLNIKKITTMKKTTQKIARIQNTNISKIC